MYNTNCYYYLKFIFLFIHWSPFSLALSYELSKYKNKMAFHYPIVSIVLKPTSSAATILGSSRGVARWSPLECSPQVVGGLQSPKKLRNLTSYWALLMEHFL